jgi:hydroxymethylpyrimidine pyrophosphatase-like HAD family hydrolase
MIKGIFLDVDGVIVGEKVGFNSPWPNEKVIDKLRLIGESGVPICLITAKPHYSVAKIIEDAKLDNFHITDGGAVVIDPINKVIASEENINSDLSSRIIETLLKNNIYAEFYTSADYFIQNDQINGLTAVHAHVLQKKAVSVDSLAKEALNKSVTKIMPIASDENDKERVTDILKPFEKEIKIAWGIHPIALPNLFGIITSPNVSKKNSAINIAKLMNIPLDNFLGIGDSTSDWQFMELCGYAGVMGNSQEDLKLLASSKPVDKFFVGGGVDENGVLDIFDHWQLG